MARPKDSKYDSYAYRRILHRVLDLLPKYETWSAMANAISDYRGADFARNNLNRLRDGELGDVLLDVLVGWLETHDPEFRLSLKPEAIFSEVGVSARDYYFHLFSMADLEEWDESLLGEFEGVYLCAPENDAHSYLPSNRVREELEGKLIVPEQWRKNRGNEIKRYIAQRSFLILKRTDAHYYHAAEVPMGALFPPEFETLDIKSFYEGVGIASSNTIHVFLRECLTRVPKLHSIIIKDKAAYNVANINGIEIYADVGIRYLRDEWKSLSGEHLDQMRTEFAEQIASDVFLRGTSQINVSPLPWTKNRVDLVYGTEQVYHRKPRNFLRDPHVHFIKPDLNIDPQLDRLIDNPLVIGEML
ncbi:hypothetical protein GGD81_004186 [Rhodobium orientis]|uniref:Uncharacterized protein n=1 Tax=Rhodobium orientis TaxID=34017 RepID=A0A327JLP5_9HYPH|nr:hypothetical protein [Rhodobium orientis]MBB4305118.1 hypothetical protein [Rhodobium orientis]MBK5950893.1 hypothetical protein [Rhodobium orientis]RAI27011.1 hypothetical protein CH339_11750 [Rhodobium orientis]